MAIDSDIVVKIDGGEVTFEAPGLNDWAFFSSFSEKNVAEIADLVIPKIKAVSGLKKKDGSEVTLENIQAKDFSLPFFNKLVALWVRTIHAASNPTEAEVKNV